MFFDWIKQHHSIADYEQALQTGDEAIYSFEYADQSKLFSPIISIAKGVRLDIKNDVTAWNRTIWMPSREQLSLLWKYTTGNYIEIELQRGKYYASSLENAGLTTSQREALVIAPKAGYFEEPQDASPSDVAAEFGVFQLAVGGMVRWGI